MDSPSAVLTTMSGERFASEALVSASARLFIELEGIVPRVSLELSSSLRVALE